jgi:hypothetical protein
MRVSDRSLIDRTYLHDSSVALGEVVEGFPWYEAGRGSCDGD